jgi:hypothetical protein
MTRGRRDDGRGAVTAEAKRPSGAAKVYLRRGKILKELAVRQRTITTAVVFFGS